MYTYIYMIQNILNNLNVCNTNFNMVVAYNIVEGVRIGKFNSPKSKAPQIIH